MVVFKFIYKKNIYETTYDENSILVYDILKKYSSFIRSSINDLIFLYNGKNLSSYKNKKIFELRKNKITIIVFNLNKILYNKKTKNILCPICKKLAFFKIKDNKIIINHPLDKINHNINYTIEEFLNNLFIDETNLKCEKCGNEHYLYEKFYICKCGIIICPLCKIYHDNEHNLIEYDKRFKLCLQHNSEYICYCEKCKLNLCYKCEEMHGKNKKHKIKYFKSLYEKIKKDENRNIIKEFIKKNNESFVWLLNFEKYIHMFNKEIENNCNNLNKIYEFISYYLDSNENYESLMNTIKLDIKTLNKKFNFLMDSENKYKFNYLKEFYNTLRDELILTYNINNNEKIRLFGEKFVENNKSECYLIINNKKKDLCEFYNINIDNKDNIDTNKELVIKYIENKKLNDLSYMFCECKDLLSISIIKWDIYEVTDLSYLFSGCKSLKSLPDFSTWDTSNITNINNIFSGCNELKFLPDTSK